MPRTALVAALVSVIILGSACSAAPDSVLPTATPQPLQDIPTATSTSLPPPTVTPYPTVTPRGAQPAETGTPDATLEEGASPSMTPTSARQPATTQPAAATSTPAAAESSTSAGGPPSQANLGRLLFSADFSQGWPAFEWSGGSIELSDGRYIFEVGPNDSGHIATTAVDAANLYAQVKVSPERCSEGTGYGLFFRYADDDNYYRVTIFCSNAYTVLARVNGSLVSSPLASGSLPSGLDASSSGPHLLSVLTSGDSFTVYFDGQTVASFTDSRLDSGDIALSAASQTSNVIRVAFDDLEIWAVR